MSDISQETLEFLAALEWGLDGIELALRCETSPAEDCDSFRLEDHRGDEVHEGLDANSADILVNAPLIPELALEVWNLRAQVKALEAERDELQAKLAKIRKLEQSLAVSIDSNEHATDICEGNEEWFRGFSESIEGIHDELVRAIGLEAE